MTEKNTKLRQLLILFMFTCTTLFISLITAYNPLWGNLIFNVIAGVAVLIYNKPSFFLKLKLSTLLILRVLMIFTVLNFMPGQFYVNIVQIFLVINILEATFTDLKHKQYFNFITGLCLALSVITLTGTWEGGLYSMTAKTKLATILWVIAYTVWNWLFVTKEFKSSIAKMHLGFLLAPTIGCLLLQNFNYWILLRANTLTFGGILQIADKDYWEEGLYTDKFDSFVSKIHKKSIQIGFMIFNLLLIGYIFFITIV